MFKHLVLFSVLCFSCIAGPNVVFIVLDDVGEYAMPPNCDTNVTPNIYSLATDGMRFTNMRSYSTCSPSRAAFMTGRETMRTEVFSAINGNLNTNEVSIAKRLQGAGYETGVFGKWNLWTLSAGEFATQDENIEFHGFDTNVTFTGPTITYPIDGDEPIAEGNFWPDVYNDAALSFIEDNQDGDFFCFYSLGLAHDPYDVGTPDDPGVTNNATDNYWVKMEYADKLIGYVIDKVEALGLESNTVFILTGDNGNASDITVNYSGTPVVGGKGSDDETATWVPFYVRWDGTITAGSTYTGLAKFSDIPVTIAEITKVGMPSDRLIDGRSFYSALTGGSAWRSPYQVLTGIAATDPTCKTLEYKYNEEDDTFFSITNKPFGDAAISTPDLLQSGVETMLKYYYTNRTINVFGDRSWGGSTNEYILHVP